MLEIEASSPLLEFGYQASCELTVDSQRNLEESIGSVEMQWLGPDGKTKLYTDCITYCVIIHLDTCRRSSESYGCHS